MRAPRLYPKQQELLREVYAAWGPVFREPLVYWWLREKGLLRPASEAEVAAYRAGLDERLENAQAVLEQCVQRRNYVAARSVLDRIDSLGRQIAEFSEDDGLGWVALNDTGRALAEQLLEKRAAEVRA